MGILGMGTFGRVFGCWEESLEVCLGHLRKQEVGSEDTGMLGLDGLL